MEKTQDGSNNRDESSERGLGGRPAIYAHLAAHLGDGDRGLSEAGQTLPDEPQAAPDVLRWASGALDGVMSHHLSAQDDLSDQVQQIARAIYACVQPVPDEAADRRLDTLYSLLIKARALSVVDALGQQILSDQAISPGALYALARYLVESAADREPLKIAISLLGLVARPDDAELLCTVGSHDEFTLFAGVALLQSQSDPLPALWSLARRVHGWGRIHLIERLVRFDPLPDSLRHWLLTEGYRNEVMIEYTALACASAGGLAEALLQDGVSDAILDGAGEILGALLTSGGPAATLDDYAQGAAALSAFMQQVERRASRLTDFAVIVGLRDWLDDDDSWPQREERGFDPDWRRELRQRCAAYLARAEWPALVRHGLQATDRQIFYRAEQAARSLGIDVFEAHFARLTAGGEGARSHYFALMQDSDPARIDRVLQVAEVDLDLASIATGPSRELGMGPTYERHNALDFILQGLGRWPGRGVHFLRAGLRSPTVRNRNLALTVLEAWPRASWPSDAGSLLAQVLSDEPDATLRARLEALVSSGPSAL